MKRIGLLLISGTALFGQQIALQPNTPTTKDGVTINITCPAGNCSIAPAIVQVTIPTTDPKWVSIALGRWNINGWAQPNIDGVIVNGQVSFLVWQPPVVITNFDVAPLGIGVAFGR